MKKVYFVVLFMSLFLITGCENMEEVTKNEYISMKNETLRAGKAQDIEVYSIYRSY